LLGDDENSDYELMGDDDVDNDDDDDIDGDKYQLNY